MHSLAFSILGICSHHLYPDSCFQSPLRQCHISTWERANEAKDTLKWNTFVVFSFAPPAWGFLMGIAALPQKAVLTPLPHSCPTMKGLSLLSVSVELQRSR